MSQYKPVFSLIVVALISTPAGAEEDIFKVGVEALKKKEYRLAIACFNDVLRQDNTNAEAYYYRGLAQNGKGFVESAIKNFNEAIRLNPKHAAAYVARGNTYIDEKDYAKAVQDHHQALQLDPKYALAHINRGNTYGQIKNYRAIEDFDVAIQLSSNDPLPYLDRGNAYLEGDKLDKAIQDFTEAIRFRSEPLAYLKRGDAHAKKADYEKAIKDYSQVILLDPKNITAYYSRSAVYQQIGDRIKSMEDWLKALELLRSPQSPQRQILKLRPPQPSYRFPIDKIGDFPHYDKPPPSK